jgi:hypothetical protein
MRTGLMIFALFLSSEPYLLSQKQPTESNGPQQSPAQDHRGTQDAPLFIKEVPTPKTKEESAADAKDRKEKSANDRKLVEFTGILALVGALQLVVFGLQSYYLRKTVQAAAEQSEDMKRAIPVSPLGAALFLPLSFNCVN